jgi:hypothetical protein
MDVHAPHQPVHTWRDFAIHLVVVTIGLFIALSLEALVEHLHQRHLLHTAETNLHIELHDNRDYLADDEHHLDLTEAHLQHDVALLLARKSNPALPDTLDFGWHWDGLQESAWTTARDSGGLALMPFDTQQGWSSIYAQQGSVDQQADAYLADIYRAEAPTKGRTFAQLSPADLVQMIAGIQQALADLDHLRDLCKSLDVIYKRTGNL